MLPSAYHQLVQALDQLPTIGTKAAERLTQHILTTGQLQPLLQALSAADAEIQRCKQCQSYIVDEHCLLCIDPQREQEKILVVANVNHQQLAEEQGRSEERRVGKGCRYGCWECFERDKGHDDE